MNDSGNIEVNELHIPGVGFGTTYKKIEIAPFDPNESIGLNFSRKTKTVEEPIENNVIDSDSCEDVVRDIESLKQEIAALKEQLAASNKELKRYRDICVNRQFEDNRREAAIAELNRRQDIEYYRQKRTGITSGNRISDSSEHRSKKIVTFDDFE